MSEVEDERTKKVGKQWSKREEKKVGSVEEEKKREECNRGAIKRAEREGGKRAEVRKGGGKC